MVGRRVVDWLPALVVFVGLVALWQGLIVWLHVQQFLLPKPTSIATTFWTDKSELWHAGWYTFQEALGGFALGSGFAILVALVLARWRPVATVLAMIGAVVGEYFGGALNAIGVLILSRSRVFQFNEAWAGVLVVCLFGLALYIAVALIERLALRWVPSTSE